VGFESTFTVELEYSGIERIAEVEFSREELEALRPFAEASRYVMDRIKFRQLVGEEDRIPDDIVEIVGAATVGWPGYGLGILANPWLQENGYLDNIDIETAKQCVLNDLSKQYNFDRDEVLANTQLRDRGYVTDETGEEAIGLYRRKLEERREAGQQQSKPIEDYTAKDLIERLQEILESRTPGNTMVNLSGYLKEILKFEKRQENSFDEGDCTVIEEAITVGVIYTVHSVRVNRTGRGRQYNFWDYTNRIAQGLGAKNVFPQEQANLILNTLYKFHKMGELELNERNVFGWCDFQVTPGYLQN